MKSDVDMATKRALLELGRLAILAAIATVVATLQQGGQVDWRVLGVSAAMAAYRAASTYVADNPNTPLKGLFPF